MIRPFTLLCFAAFAGAGAWLYGVKHSVAVQDRELREIRRETEVARERIAILRAEWALLNEPERLRGVAQRHLQLESMLPTHFTHPAELGRRLPGAVQFAGAPDLFAPPPAAAEPPRSAGPIMLAAAAVTTPSVRPAPAPVAAPAAARPAPAAETTREVEAPAPQALAGAIAAQRAELASRAAVPAVPARAAPPVARPAPAPRPVQPAIHRAPPAEPVIRVARGEAEPPVRTAPAPTTVASVLGGSALGRPSLAPPVPFGSAVAATLDGHRGLAPPAR
jgi:hypothetical protein